MVKLILGIAMLATTACVTSTISMDDPSVPAGFRKLSGAQIQTRLVGRTLTFINQHGGLAVTSAHRERYFPDGSLSVAVDRGAGRGRYRILDDRFCLTVETDNERCRFLLESNERRLFVLPIDTDYIEGLAEIRIIE